VDEEWQQQAVMHAKWAVFSPFDEIIVDVM
jgi:hypothetical protein